MRWCRRVQGWILLYRSGHLLSRTDSPAFEQIVSCLEHESIQGEILEQLLTGDQERAAAHRLVARLDKIAGELCDRRLKLSVSRANTR